MEVKPKFRYYRFVKDKVHEWTRDSKARILREKHQELEDAPLELNKKWTFFQKMYRNFEARQVMKQKRNKVPFINCTSRTVELVQQRKGSGWRKEEAKFLYICALGLQPKQTWDGLAEIEIVNRQVISSLGLTLKLKQTKKIDRVFKKVTLSKTERKAHLHG